MSLPSWPERDPIHHEPGAVEIGGHEYDTCPTCHAYERAMKEAYAARLRLAVEALKKVRSDSLLRPDGVWEPHTRSGKSRTAAEALAAIGEVPQG